MCPAPGRFSGLVIFADRAAEACAIPSAFEPEDYAPVLPLGLVALLNATHVFRE